jgi:hypothetical protein
VAGDFNTGFIAEHYGQGLLAPRTCRTKTRCSLVALAAFVRRKARERSAGISGQLAGHGVKHLPDLVVVVLGTAGAARAPRGAHRRVRARLGQGRRGHRGPPTSPSRARAAWARS